MWKYWRKRARSIQARVDTGEGKCEDFVQGNDIEMGDMDKFPKKLNNRFPVRLRMQMSRTRYYARMSAAMMQFAESRAQKNSLMEAVESMEKMPEIFTIVGLHELRMRSMYKAMVVEFLGTASYIFFHIGICATGIYYEYPAVPIGLGHAMMLTMFIYQFAMSSGAHFNSMVTFSSILTGHIPLVRGLLYIIIQIAGATTGAVIMRESISPEIADAILFGSCNKGSLAPRQALSIEFFFTLALLYPVYGMAFNVRQREIYGAILPPIIIGLSLAFVIFASSSLAPAPYTGAIGNPSMCLGIAIAYRGSTFEGHERAMDYLWIWWLGPYLACIVNAAVYLIAPPHHQADEAQRAITPQTASSRSEKTFHPPIQVIDPSVECA